MKKQYKNLEIEIISINSDDIMFQSEPEYQEEQNIPVVEDLDGYGL